MIFENELFIRIFLEFSICPDFPATALKTYQFSMNQFCQKKKKTKKLSLKFSTERPSPT